MHSFRAYTYQGNGKVAISDWCPGADQPIFPALIKAAVVKALPHPAIGSSPPANGTPLVNIDTVFWLAGGDGYQPIGSARLLGHGVDFQGRITSAAWSFGDGATESSDGPGNAYDRVNHPCTTRRCDGYFTHMYVSKGDVTVTATAHWAAQYRVDGGGWVDVGAVDSAAVALRLHVWAARSVLVRPR